MRDLIMGVFLPADAKLDKLNGFLCSTMARFGRRFDVFHSREQCRALIESMRGKVEDAWIEENMKYVELSTLPETSDRPVVRLPTLLALFISRILARAIRQDGPGTLEVVTSLRPRLSQALFPIDVAAKDGLLAVMDGEALVYVFSSKEQARLLTARHARIFENDVQARFLARIDECEFLPERSDTEIATVDGYVACVLCTVFDREKARAAAAN